MSSIADITKAAFTVIGNIRPSLIGHRRNPKKIALVLEPIFGPHWAKHLSISVGSGGINDFLHCVRGTSLSKEKIETARRLRKETFFAEDGPIPIHWELRRPLIASFLLYEVTPCTRWMAVASSLEQSYLFTPLDHSVLSY